MPEVEERGGASTVQGGATGGENETQVSTESAKTVAYEDHKRALDDMHRFKRELNDLRQKMSADEAAALAAKEDFKSLAEKYKNERDQFESDLSKERNLYRGDLKMRAVREAAVKAGLRNLQDLDLLPLDDVKEEYTSEGRMLFNGVEEFVTRLKAGRPHWFQDKSAPVFNGGGANGEHHKEEPLTAAKVIELEHKYRREGKPDKVKELYQAYYKQKTARA